MSYRLPRVDGESLWYDGVGSVRRVRRHHGGGVRLDVRGVGGDVRRRVGQGRNYRAVAQGSNGGNGALGDAVYPGQGLSLVVSSAGRNDLRGV